MSSYSEEDIQSAIRDVEAGMSTRKAALQRGIPPTTLHNRLHRTESRTMAAESLQRLSQKQEKDLAGWVMVQEMIGEPPTYTQIRDVASQVLQADGDTEPLGRNWIDGFLRRHPEVNKALREGRK